MKNQKGFSAVVIILIIVVVGVACGAGYYVWDRSHKSSWNADDESFVVKTTPKPTVTVAPPATTAKYDQHFDIKEWGVRVSFDDADKVVYSMSSDNNVSLRLKDSVTNIEGCKDLGIGFTRSTKSEPVRTSITKAGNYYYWLGGGPGACLDPSDPNYSIEQLRNRIISDELGSNKYSITTIN